MLSMESLFVNRALELAAFDAVLRDTAAGRRRHVALLGLRRIGKTMLLDEVRRRHPSFAISYLALDEVVATPEDFAHALVAETLRAAGGNTATVGYAQSDDELRASAGTAHPSIATAVGEILRLAQGGTYGALLIAVMRFPGLVSETLDLPLLLMLDEFQEVARLRDFSGTENLLGTIRAALDRPGKVSYAVAGSRVTALRNLLGGSENPLLTRFEPIELHPFASDATFDLATRLWDQDELRYEPDAGVRLQKLTGGWPFYVQAIAGNARQIAASANRRVTPDLIDAAFQREVFGRSANIGQYCRYLLDTATRTEGEALRNTIESVLRVVARWQPVTRLSVVRRLSRHHSYAQIHRAISRLVDTDFVSEETGALVMLDPLFAFWLAAEPARRDPEATIGSRAIKRLMVWYEAQHADDRAEIGALFEKRIENLVRQFRGQTVDGKLFGVEGNVRLPVVREAGKAIVPDPTGQFGDGPDTYEVDIVSAGDSPDDVWGIEAKHRRGAITRAMLQRFIANARAVAKAGGRPFCCLWIVAPRGIRPDGYQLATQEGVLTSGLRDLDKIEALVAVSPTTTPAIRLANGGDR